MTGISMYAICIANKMRLPRQKPNHIRKVMNRGRRKYSLSAATYKQHEENMKVFRQSVSTWYDAVFESYFKARAEVLSESGAVSFIRKSIVEVTGSDDPNKLNVHVRMPRLD